MTQIAYNDIKKLAASLRYNAHLIKKLYCKKKTDPNYKNAMEFARDCDSLLNDVKNNIDGETIDSKYHQIRDKYTSIVRLEFKNILNLTQPHIT